MQSLVPIRNILYDILNAGVDDDNHGNVNATQNLGIALSNGIRKDGVNIIQMQSVINKTIVHKVTDALKLLDDYHADNQTVVNMLPDKESNLLEYTPEEDNTMEPTIDESIKQDLKSGVTLKEFLDDMSRRYIQTARDIYGVDDGNRRIGIRKNKKWEELLSNHRRENETGV